MEGYFWEYNFEPDFPLHILKFHTEDSENTIHWHNYLQICLCTEGAGKFIFTNREYSFEPGDVFIVDNFENHMAVSEANVSAAFLFVIFLPEFIAYPGGRQFDFAYLYPFRYDPGSFNHKIAADTPLAKEIAGLVRDMEETANAKGAGYKHLLDATLRCILALLINHYETTYADYHYEKNSHVKIQQALDYINKNFSQRITLEDLSEQVFMSKSRFAHLFKETVRLGFKEYLTYIRLTNARKLLLTSDLSISDVAAQTGFSNINQFYKVFNKYVGVSPADYRKQYRQNSKQIED